MTKGESGARTLLHTTMNPLLQLAWDRWADAINLYGNREDCKCPKPSATFTFSVEFDSKQKSSIYVSNRTSDIFENLEFTGQNEIDAVRPMVSALNKESKELISDMLANIDVWYPSDKNIRDKIRMIGMTILKGGFLC